MRQLWKNEQEKDQDGKEKNSLNGANNGGKSIKKKHGKKQLKTRKHGHWKKWAKKSCKTG